MTYVSDGKPVSDADMPSVQRVRELLRRMDERRAAEAAKLRYILEERRNLENAGSSGKRRRRRRSGSFLPNGALSPEQIEEIGYYSSLPLSYGEISELMGISKSSAYKYGKDFRFL